MKLTHNIFSRAFITLIILFSLNIETIQAEEFHITSGEDFEDALILASKNGEADTIWLKMGIYNTGSYNYYPEEGEDYGLTIKGETGTTAKDIIIEGNGEDGGLFFEQDSASINIEGITVRNCGTGIKISNLGDVSLTNSIIIDNSNGGVSIGRIGSVNTNITMTNNTITNNGGNFGGFGGIAISGNVVTISNNIISNNHSMAGGGGISFGNNGTCDVSITDNTISENVAKNSGGGIYIRPHIDGDVRLINNTITGNVSTNGAGVYFENFLNVNITLNSNTITKNKTKNGGAVYGTGVNIYTSSGNITLISNNISENTMEGFTSNIDIPVGHGAGGYITSSSGNISLVQNIITGNKMMNMNLVGYGGGLKIETSESGDISLVNNAISNNTSDNFGGGAYIVGNAKITLTNNTITKNITSADGGGLYLDCTGEDTIADIYNNIIWGNEGNEGNDIYNSKFLTALIYVHNNNFHDKQGESFTEEIDNIDDDPLLVNHENGDYHLLPDSPCIDNGNASAPELPSTDFEGDLRIIGSSPDIGADEFDPSAPPTTTTTPVTTTALTTITTTVPSSTTTTSPLTSTSTIASSQPCTAALIYGGDSEEAELLRFFRDSVLNQTPESRELIRLYYQWSPVIVKIMKEDEEFKEEVKEVIDGVLVLIAEAE